MNVKSMLAGFLIAVLASTGTYFLVPPPNGANAGLYLSREDIKEILSECMVGNKGATMAEIVSFSGHKLNSPVLETYVKPGREAAKRARTKLDHGSEQTEIIVSEKVAKWPNQFHFW